jgi:hypothetical protein
MANAIVPQPVLTEVSSSHALLARLKAFLTQAQEDATRITRQASANLVGPASVALLTFDLEQAQEALRCFEERQQAELDHWADAHAPQEDKLFPLIDGDDDVDRMQW